MESFESAVNQLSIPKVLTKDGKVRDPNAKESLLYMFEHYGVTQPIVVENRSLIRSLCDCVLEISDAGFLNGKRGHLTFEDESEEGAAGLRTSAMEKCSALATAVEKKGLWQRCERLSRDTLGRPQCSCARQ
jgi:hypothetical protein